MKIAMTTCGCDSGLSGIGRYASMLLAEWIDTGVDLKVLGHDSDYSAFLPTQQPMDWHTVAEVWKSPLMNICWHQFGLAAAIRHCDVLFLPAGNRRLPLISNTPSVGTIHDCSSFHVDGKYDRARDLYIKRVLPLLMRQLDHVVTVSESTRSDLVHFCGVDSNRITVIPLAVDHTFFFLRDRELATIHLRRMYKVAKPFLLYISRIEHPGKNHVRLIRAFEVLKRRYRIPHQLVFVGPDKERSDEVHAVAGNSLFREEIIFTGPIPSGDLPLFYSAADVFVFPSMYEGFGLPLLEAMACELPTACSNRSSLPEVGGDHTVVFDPDDPTDIASAIHRLLSEADADRSVRTRAAYQHSLQFNWHQTAQRTLQVIQNCSR